MTTTLTPLQQRLIALFTTHEIQGRMLIRPATPTTPKCYCGVGVMLSDTGISDERLAELDQSGVGLGGRSFCPNILLLVREQQDVRDALATLGVPSNYAYQLQLAVDEALPGFSPMPEYDPRFAAASREAAIRFVTAHDPADPRFQPTPPDPRVRPTSQPPA